MKSIYKKFYGVLPRSFGYRCDGSAVVVVTLVVVAVVTIGGEGSV